MSFKALASKLWAGLDRIVAEIEDHDALVTASLRELVRAKEQATRELDQAHAYGHALRERLSHARRDVNRLRRAAASETDDLAAIERLRGARRASEQALRLEERFREHAVREGRIERHVTELGERIIQLEQQRRILESRAARGGGESDGSVDELLERWEASLPRVGVADETDDAFDALSRREEDQTLWAELEELRSRRQP